jgi:uncharacterized protein YecE (DUF72 family)
MIEGMRVGTCSWNYDSWVPLVYSAPKRKAAEYLREYSGRFRTAEIDSWFYKIPERREVEDYLSEVDEDFAFTVKATESLSLTHERAGRGEALSPNPDFLSPAQFATYVERIGPMLPRVQAVMLEFEYLSREKMPSLEAFIKALEGFAASVSPGIPLAVETRNKNFLEAEYFQFLASKGIAHVFSEKIYMPHVYEVYGKYSSYINGTTVIRLLGGDRKEMEARTGGRWDRIVDEKPDKPRVAEMSKDIIYRGGRVVININNHYEGSAPLTALFFEGLS